MTRSREEEYAARELAVVLNYIAAQLADAAAKVRQIADLSAAGHVGQTGYLNRANQTWSLVANLIPNLPLTRAMVEAAGADLARNQQDAES